jgi:hypothetical protein
MATSVLAFESYSSTVDSSGLTASHEFNINPPSNIAGKLCYGEVTFFSFERDTVYSFPTIHILEQQGWSQVQSVYMTDTLKQTLNPPIAAYTYGVSSGKGAPFLFNMPDGPHTIKFTVSCAGGGVLTSDVTEAQLPFFIMMNVVPANSRPPPINV